MQAYHCVFGFGALIGPLIVEPFLLDTDTQTHVSIPGKRVYNADSVNIEHLRMFTIQQERLTFVYLVNSRTT